MAVVFSLSLIHDSFAFDGTRLHQSCKIK